MSTIHNPVNFDPTAYTIVGYFDNQPPQCYGNVIGFAENMKAWRQEREYLFPQSNCYRCTHCGNGSVRYVVAADHIPTGERVCFGDICVNRLEIPNRDAFKMKCIRSRAQARAKAEKLGAAIAAFLEQEPDIAAAQADIDKPEHAKNSFVRDVLRKLNQYGDLSDKQVWHVVKSMERDRQYAARKAAEKAAVVPPTAPSPVGRAAVTGKVVHIKEIETEGRHMGGYYAGAQILYKMLMVLDTGAKVWCSIPRGMPVDGRLLQKTITITATWTRSDKDEFFSFGSRPRYNGPDLINPVAVQTEFPDTVYTPV